MDHKDQRRVWFSYHAAVVLVISNSIRLFPGLLTPQSLAAQCVKAFRKTFVSQSARRIKITLLTEIAAVLVVYSTEAPCSNNPRAPSAQPKELKVEEQR
jgi:hypothetical protein